MTTPARITSSMPATPPITPGVSLTMIVKNEEHNLPACLESVRDLVDEIIVVDTGSNDATKSIAAGLGAKVFDFEWVDDFAAARNESIRHATKEWILWLDADDRLDEENRVRLRAFFSRLPSANVVYMMKCSSLLDDGTTMVFDQTRLFRNDPRTRFESRCHERIAGAVESAEVRWINVVVQHVGYQDYQKRLLKERRNQRLFRLQNLETPNDPFTLFHLGVSIAKIDSVAEGLPYLQRGLAILSKSHEAITFTMKTIQQELYRIISDCHFRLGQTQQALAVCREGRRVFPNDTKLLEQELRLGNAIPGSNLISDVRPAMNREEKPMPKTQPSNRREGSVQYTDEEIRRALRDKKDSVHLAAEGLGCAAEVRVASSMPATPQVEPGPDTNVRIVTAQTITASPAAENRIGQILLCQPTYGHPVADSQRAFWVGHTLPGGLARRRSMGGAVSFTSASGEGSLLAFNFNQFWAMALNMREEGEDITHFAMLHDDVVPEDGWLDKLLEDQLSSGADLVSAVIPIKNHPDGKVSTMLCNKDSAGTVKGGISMRGSGIGFTVSDLPSLPPVFTAADCGHPEMRLLVNTGCWICRLDRDWVNAKNDDGSLKVFFTIQDRIVYKDGKWQAVVFPEDYNFSLMVQENGGTVAATRRIRLYHEGRGQWHLPGI